MKGSKHKSGLLEIWPIEKMSGYNVINIFVVYFVKSKKDYKSKGKQ